MKKNRVKKIIYIGILLSTFSFCTLFLFVAYFIPAYKVIIAGGDDVVLKFLSTNVTAAILCLIITSITFTALTIDGIKDPFDDEVSEEDDACYMLDDNASPKWSDYKEPESWIKK